MILGDINTDLAPGIRLPRTDVLDILTDAIESSQIVLVQGAPGSGKSAIMKTLLATLPDGIVPFVFKAQEFNFTHLHRDGTVIRQRPELHRAVIVLLDKLVERGSYTGFRLRDYIISPLPTISNARE